jgi:hypothetical protein
VAIWIVDSRSAAFQPDNFWPHLILEGVIPSDERSEESRDPYGRQSVRKVKRPHFDFPRQ